MIYWYVVFIIRIYLYLSNLAFTTQYILRHNIQIYVSYYPLIDQLFIEFCLELTYDIYCYVI